MMPSSASPVPKQGWVKGEEAMVTSHMSFYFQPSPLPPHLTFPPIGFQHSLGSLDSTSPLGGEATTHLGGGLHPMPLNPKDVDSAQFGASLGQRPTGNPWSWGEEGDIGRKGESAAGEEHQHHGSSKSGNSGSLSVAASRMKKVKARRKVREPRFCFKTMSEVDVLDDGYKWRKYGQKVVKNTQHPRSYYRCVQDECRVKKRVERMAEDPRMVITTYEGRHVHSPSRDEDDESRASSHARFFW